jgi:type II secretory pathway component PulM
MARPCAQPLRRRQSGQDVGALKKSCRAVITYAARQIFERIREATRAVGDIWKLQPEACHALALVVVLLLGVTAKVFFHPKVAETTLTENVMPDVRKMHENVAMPVQEVHDMSVIYTDRD